MKVQQRFTSRVDNYIKYRPHYPDAVYEWLREREIILPGMLVADVGAGTGISSELFLQHAHIVYAIEPNAEMLNAAKNKLYAYSNFCPVHRSAEDTGLPDESVSLIVCAQAFHWLDREKSKKEFKRILKPGGHVVLLWNDRRTDSSDFLKVYEDFLQMFGTDYKEVNHKNTQQKEVFEEFFGGEFKEACFDNFQMLDFEGLKGRVLSASYMPDASHPDYEFMLYCLKKIFNRYEENGKVKLEYDTRLYCGIIQ
jgi:ubiquinone/menaquinone biosynthesis C-methylase UbiE